MTWVPRVPSACPHAAQNRPCASAPQRGHLVTSGMGAATAGSFASADGRSMDGTKRVAAPDGAFEKDLRTGPPDGAGDGGGAAASGGAAPGGLGGGTPEDAGTGAAAEGGAAGGAAAVGGTADGAGGCSERSGFPQATQVFAPGSL